MRKLSAFLATLVVVAALVLGHGDPASAHNLQPGQISIDSAYGCGVKASYGTFGDGFAQIEMLGVPTACSAFSGVHVLTVHGSGESVHTHEIWCFADQAIYAPTSNCNATVNPSSNQIVIRAVVVGTAIYMDSYPCHSDDCLLYSHGMLE